MRTFALVLTAAIALGFAGRRRRQRGRIQHFGC
jgi:hypothetical protein